MCIYCNTSFPCNCEPSYTTHNWFNTDSYPCNPCTTTQVCKKKISSKCVTYNGPALTGIGLNTNIDTELILSTIAITIDSLKDVVASNKSGQNTINANILIVLNDINSRLNAITGDSHSPYSI